MRTLEFADAAVLQMAIRQDIERSEESRYDYRLHGVLLVASGRPCTAASQVFGEDARRRASGTAQVAGSAAVDASGA